MWRSLVLTSWIATGIQAYVPIQWIKSPVKGAVLMPRWLAGRFQSLSPAQSLMIMVPTLDMFPDGIPYFTINSNETISWDGWCIEAGGDRRRDLVLVTQCSGKPTQKWAWITDGHGRGMIQLKDSRPGKCLDVIGTVGLDAASIGLRECDSQATSWQLGAPIANLTHRTSRNLRHVAMSLLALAGFGVLSLGSLLWALRPKAHTLLAGSESGMLLGAERGGVALVTPWALRQDFLNCRGCVMMQQSFDAPDPVSLEHARATEFVQEETVSGKDDDHDTEMFPGTRNPAWCQALTEINWRVGLQGIGLDAMCTVDRAEFAPGTDAYGDHPVGIGHKATISAPHMHAYAIRILAPVLKPGAKVLDVGCGSGYLSAVMAHMVGPTGRVVGIDYLEVLVELSRANICKSHAYLLNGDTPRGPRLRVEVGDGWKGNPKEAPFDGIHVGAAAATMPDALLQQLKPGGRMVIPVDHSFMLVDKDLNGKISKSNLFAVNYVPLVELPD